MKVVTGSITTSKRISLSKAAKTLSKFISTENGASQAVSAYLKRASSSFNELIQFHSNLESGKLDRTKNKKSRILLERSSVVSHGEEDGLEGQIQETGGLDDGGRNSERKKKKMRELLDETGIEMEDELDYSTEKREKKKKRRERKEKKRKKIEIEDELDDSNEKRKKKKKRIKQLS